MPLHTATNQSVQTATEALTKEWGCAPIWRVACIGGTDEHHQAYHPAYVGRGDMPGYTLMDGVLEMHPDAPPGVRGDLRSAAKMAKYRGA